MRPTGTAKTTWKTAERKKERQERSARGNRCAGRRRKYQGEEQGKWRW